MDQIIFKGGDRCLRVVFSAGKPTLREVGKAITTPASVFDLRRKIRLSCVIHCRGRWSQPEPYPKLTQGPEFAFLDYNGGRMITSIGIPQGRDYGMKAARELIEEARQKLGVAPPGLT